MVPAINFPPEIAFGDDDKARVSHTHGHANVNTTKKVYAAYEMRTLQKGFAKFNPSATQQVAELEAEQARRRGQHDGTGPDI